MSKRYTLGGSDAGPSRLPFDRAPHLSVLVGASDLARLLDLSNPAVVTNWRSRARAFPPERTGGGQPRFDLAEVLEWLQYDGPRGRELPTISPLVWWSELARAYVAAARAHQARPDRPTAPPPRNTVLALVLLRQQLTVGADPSVDGRERWDRLRDTRLATPNAEADSPLDLVPGADVALLDVARWAEQRFPRIDGLLVPYLDLDERLATYAYDLVAALERAAEVPVSALVRTVVELDDDGQRHDQRRTYDVLGEVMVSLARPQVGDVVLDPALGEGSLLLEFARRVDGAHLAGQESDAHTWAFVRTRFLLEGRDLDAGERPDDTLTSDQHRKLRADVVLLDPPLDDSESPLARWLLYGLNHLREGGRMVVALPLHELVKVRSVRRRPNERVRNLVQKVLAEDRVESVVVLPRGARADVSGPVAILTVAEPVVERRPVVVGIAPTRRRSVGPLADLDPEFLTMLRNRSVVDVLALRRPGISARACAPGEVFGELERVEEGELERVQSAPSSRRMMAMSKPRYDELDIERFRGELPDITDEPLVAELLLQLARVPARDRQDLVARMLLDLGRFKPPLR